MPGMVGERGTLLQAERLAKGGTLKKGKTEKRKDCEKRKESCQEQQMGQMSHFRASCPGPPYLRLNKWRSRILRIQSLPGVILLKCIAIYFASTKSCSR